MGNSIRKEDGLFGLSSFSAIDITTRQMNFVSKLYGFFNFGPSFYDRPKLKNQEALPSFHIILFGLPHEVECLHQVQRAVAPLRIWI
ncbi:hypothetical protein SDC9_183529 [bioreactor metagenome]|uniref:Uncharacterized protein n=1 Tax=bioreactor metagenome TaxID=1076179 RepID=A0A645HIS6_9ZZZZ